MKKKHHELTKAEERDLDGLAAGNEFWSRIGAAYAEWDSHTEKQYAMFSAARNKESWRLDAPRLDDKPIRNKYTADDGRPRYAHREKPWCKDAATIVVGTYGYCREHAPTAQESLDDWLASRKAERAKDRLANDGVGGGVGAVEAIPQRTKSRLAQYLDDLTSNDDDVPF